MSLFDILRAHAATQPGRVALDDGAVRLRFGELPAAIADRAAQLRAAGCWCLAIAGDNGVDWALWDLAALEAGLPVVPLPPFFTPDQRAASLAAAGVSHVALGPGLSATGLPPANLPPGTDKITFTSGSTGAPKGVCLPQAGLDAVARSLVHVIGAEAVDIHMCVLPLAVLLENVAGLQAGLRAGATIHLPPLAGIGFAKPFNPDFGALLAALCSARATSLILVPELLRGLMAAIAAGGPRPSALKFVAVGGARVAPALLTEAQRLGLPVHEGYGLSECGSVVALNPPGAARPGSAGKLLPHVLAHVVEGEIVIANPCFLGYLGQPPRDAAPLHTGDLGQVDGQGRVTLEGRLGNLLITAFGRNVSPEWVESLLLAEPAIAQAIVHGDGAQSLGALLVPAAPGADLDAAIAAANAGLPAYAHVTHFRAIAPLTAAEGFLTGNGRPRRDRIHAHYLKENSMTFFDRLQQETARQRQALYAVPQLVDGLSGAISRQTYIAYLTEAYHHVRHTVRFLMAMGARLPLGKSWLHDAIAEYIEEEKGHEAWILNDITAAGGDADAARDATPNLETQLLVAYNYDYIARKNPVGFLGMVFMLESTSTEIASWGADALRTSLDLPNAAFTYLYSHGALDIEHMAFFQTLVNRITDPEDQAAIIEVAQNSFRLFAGLMSAIPHQAKRHAA